MTSQYATFTIDDLFLGVDIARVQEVVPCQPMTRVPRAPLTVRGLINLRGQIVTAIDLRRRLGRRDLPDGKLPTNVIVRDNEGILSLLVDQIGDVLKVAEESFEAVPETVRGAARELIRGAHKLPGRLLLVLNLDKAVAIPDSLSA